MALKRPKDKIPLLLFGGCLFLCWFFVLRHGAFGSKVDWITQHSVFPDYFRQLFYSTGNLFTGFAPQLGAGQNLFYFSYYGLYSPIILISYLLPFVKMSDYIMLSSIFCYCISVTLFYRWIGTKCDSRITAAGLGCMFALASPMLYHSYNQIMFVNYMPFLCLALIGTDRYMKERKSGLLIAATVGMILTSFYFSVGGMLVLILYSMSVYIQKHSIKESLQWMMGYVMRLILAVMSCGILLLPTAATLCGGRGNMGHWDWSLLLPAIQWDKLLFSPNGIGLSVSAVLVLLWGVLGRKSKDRGLSFVILLLLTTPAVCVLLNGGLYAKTKVFIPFLPLILYLYVPFLQGVFETKRRWMQVALPFAAAIVLFMVNGIIHPLEDTMEDWDFYHKIEDEIQGNLMENVADWESGCYRMEELGGGRENKANINRIRTIEQSISSIYSSSYNPNYMKFRQEYGLNQPYRNNMMQSATDNPCFLAFMGVRYLWSTDEIPGYITAKKASGEQTAAGLKENEQALPVIYTTSKLMEEDTYQSLEFPHNQTALLQAAVVDKTQSTQEQKQIFEKTTCMLPEIDTKTMQIHQTEDGYEITVTQETQLDIPLQRPQEDNLLAMSFEVENHKPNQDMYIKLQQQTNKLTSSSHEYANHNNQFTYVVGQQRTPEIFP